MHVRNKIVHAHDLVHTSFKLEMICTVLPHTLNFVQWVLYFNAFISVCKYVCIYPEAINYVHLCDINLTKPVEQVFYIMKHSEVILSMGMALETRES